MRRVIIGMLLSAWLLSHAGAAGESAERPWANRSLSNDARAAALLAAMTQAEKLNMVFGYFSTDAPWKHFMRPKDGLDQAAGFVPGVARLGIPALNETDAGIGVASQSGPQPRLSTALPANIGLAASFDPDIARAGGAMIGNEARSYGFNVQLAGGINLVREPRNGRNFEYGGEDPWLASQIVAAQVRGIQSNGLISTVKHFALNDQETQRTSVSVQLAEAAARMSDLLAFELAIEAAHPGAVMCSYNRINAVYACENDWLLNRVLKGDWQYPGFVMSDWGAVHSTIPAANAGLDQESGYPFDASPYFGDALREAVADGYVPQARLDDMVLRILRSMFAAGLFDAAPDTQSIDYAAHARVALDAAAASMVLLKNANGILPLKKTLRSVLVVGSHADVGVLSGGGSSQVYSAEGFSSFGNDGPIYFKSSPLDALRSKLPAKVSYDDGSDVRRAAKLAQGADLVIIFAQRWDREGADSRLSLDGNGDALIAALAKTNRRVVVVLQTGGPVLMPWLPQVAGVLEAWYPGSSGGEAIARILTGEVEPSGRLPVSFPKSAAQLPRPTLDGTENTPDRPTVDYDIEGAAVGYKWFDLKGREPLFPFGFGLTYGTTRLHDLTASTEGTQVTVSFVASNASDRPHVAVAQVYVRAPRSAQFPWEASQRLCGFLKLPLEPGESRLGHLNIEPRLLGVYLPQKKAWWIAEDDYEFLLAQDERTPRERVTLHVSERIVAYGGN